MSVITSFVKIRSIRVEDELNDFERLYETYRYSPLHHPSKLKNKNLPLPNARNLATVQFPVTSSRLIKVCTFTAVDPIGLSQQGLLTYLWSLTTSSSNKENYLYCTRRFWTESRYNQFTTSSCFYCPVILPALKYERYSALQHKNVYSLMAYCISIIGLTDRNSYNKTN